MTTTSMFVIFILLYLLLIWKAGKTYPILYLFLFTYFIQYIFSTHLIYHEYGELTHLMPVGPDRYFDFAIPAIVALFAGVILFNKDIDISKSLERIDPDQANKLGYFLLIVSYSLDFLSWIGLTWLSSLLSFTGYLKYMAAFCFLFTRSKFNYFLIALIYIQLMGLVLQAGVFITFFIWSTFLFFFISLKFRFSFLLRSSLIVAAVPLLVLVQSIKDQYRTATWTGKRETGVKLFTELAEKQAKDDRNQPFAQSTGMVNTIGRLTIPVDCAKGWLRSSFAQSTGMVNTIGRLTQGWHVGLTLKQVPSKKAFSNGEEMFNDAISSILPRLFFSDKKVVNSQDKFYQYTGHKLTGNTSMTIGLLGDFYINFGSTGAVIGLFIFGAIVAKLFRYFTVKFVLPDPINIIWIPFILNYLIRANNDFYIFFNGLVKGFIVFLIVNYLRHRIWKKNTVLKVPAKPIEG